MISHGVCNSFKLELLRGIHTPGDEYRAALYRAVAVLSKDTLVYTTDGEHPNTGGYLAGGMILTARKEVLDGDTAILSWASPMWPAASITARGALIFNASKDNRAVCVMDFERDFVSTAGNWTLPIPPATAIAGLIRIT